jgi:hypothetical protein
MRASHHPKAESADRASAVGHHHRGGVELGDDGSEAAKAADTIRRARSVSEIRFENVHVVRGVQIVQSRRRFVTVSHAMEAMGRRRIGFEGLVRDTGGVVARRVALVVGLPIARRRRGGRSRRAA